MNGTNKHPVTIQLTLVVDGEEVHFVTGKAECRDPKDPRYRLLLLEMLYKVYKGETEVS